MTTGKGFLNYAKRRTLVISNQESRIEWEDFGHGGMWSRNFFYDFKNKNFTRIILERVKSLTGITRAMSRLRDE